MSEINKRRRPEESNDPEHHHQEVLALLISKLHLDGQVDTETESKPFQEQIQEIQHDKQLLQALQESFNTLQRQVNEKEIETHQHYSKFNSLLDPAVRERIVNYLDEEGLWTLEESTMMQLDEDIVMHKWKVLWEDRKNHFPDMAGGDGDEDDDSDGDSDEGDNQNEEAREMADFRRERWKTYGVLFARASRMARCLEQLAQVHYNTNFRLHPKPEGYKYPCQWPTHTCKTLRVDRMDNTFFVRITYLYDYSKDPLVLEGFVETLYYDIREEVDHSEIVLEFLHVEQEVSDLLYRELNEIYNEEFEIDEAMARYHTELASAKQRMGNRLSITVLEMDNGIDRDHEQIYLVVSTTGFSSEDGEYLYLSPRSAKLQDTGSDFDWRVRVGLELEQEGQSLKIQLTG